MPAMALISTPPRGRTRRGTAQRKSPQCAWVLADEVGLHLLDTGQNGGAVAFQHGLAPAGQALVGHDLNKAPAGRTV